MTAPCVWVPIAVAVLLVGAAREDLACAQAEVQGQHHGSACPCDKDRINPSHGSQKLSFPLEDSRPGPCGYGYRVERPPEPEPVKPRHLQYDVVVPDDEPETKTYAYRYEVNAAEKPEAPARLGTYRFQVEMPTEKPQKYLRGLRTSVDRVLNPCSCGGPHTYSQSEADYLKVRKRFTPKFWTSVNGPTFDEFTKTDGKYEDSGITNWRKTDEHTWGASYTGVGSTELGGTSGQMVVEESVRITSEGCAIANESVGPEDEVAAEHNWDMPHEGTEFRETEGGNAITKSEACETEETAKDLGSAQAAPVDMDDEHSLYDLQSVSGSTEELSGSERFQLNKCDAPEEADREELYGVEDFKEGDVSSHIDTGSIFTAPEYTEIYSDHAGGHEDGLTQRMEESPEGRPQEYSHGRDEVEEVVESYPVPPATERGYGEDGFDSPVDEVATVATQSVQSNDPNYVPNNPYYSRARLHEHVDGLTSTASTEPSAEAQTTGTCAQSMQHGVPGSGNTRKGVNMQVNPFFNSLHGKSIRRPSFRVKETLGVGDDELEKQGRNHPDETAPGERYTPALEILPEYYGHEAENLHEHHHPAQDIPIYPDIHQKQIWKPYTDTYYQQDLPATTARKINEEDGNANGTVLDTQNEIHYFDKDVMTDDNNQNNAEVVEDSEGRIDLKDCTKTPIEEKHEQTHEEITESEIFTNTPYEVGRHSKTYAHLKGIFGGEVDEEVGGKKNTFEEETSLNSQAHSLGKTQQSTDFEEFTNSQPVTVNLVYNDHVQEIPEEEVEATGDQSQQSYHYDQEGRSQHKVLTSKLTAAKVNYDESNSEFDVTPLILEGAQLEEGGGISMSCDQLTPVEDHPGKTVFSDGSAHLHEVNNDEEITTNVGSDADEVPCGENDSYRAKETVKPEMNSDYRHTPDAQQESGKDWKHVFSTDKLAGPQTLDRKYYPYSETESYVVTEKQTHGDEEAVESTPLRKHDQESEVGRQTHRQNALNLRVTIGNGEPRSEHEERRKVEWSAGDDAPLEYTADASFHHDEPVSVSERNQYPNAGNVHGEWSGVSGDEVDAEIDRQKDCSDSECHQSTPDYFKHFPSYDDAKKYNPKLRERHLRKHWQDPFVPEERDCEGHGQELDGDSEQYSTESTPLDLYDEESTFEHDSREDEFLEPKFTDDKVFFKRRVNEEWRARPREIAGEPSRCCDSASAEEDQEDGETPFDGRRHPDSMNCSDGAWDGREHDRWGGHKHRHVGRGRKPVYEPSRKRCYKSDVNWKKLLESVTTYRKTFSSGWRKVRKRGKGIPHSGKRTRMTSSEECEDSRRRRPSAWRKVFGPFVLRNEKSHF